MIRAMQEEAKAGGTEFAGMAPEEMEAATREKMRERLEAESDKLFQRMSDNKTEARDLEKQMGEKIVGFMGSLIGSTWDEMKGIYSTWQSASGYEA
jgi:poly(A) polymerase Pap1